MSCPSSNSEAPPPQRQRTYIHLCVAESSLTATIEYTAESTLGDLVKICRKLLPSPSLLGVLYTNQCADLESQYTYNERLVNIGFEGDVLLTCIPPGYAKFTAPLPFIDLATPQNIRRVFAPKKPPSLPIAWTPVGFAPVQPVSEKNTPPRTSMAKYRAFMGQCSNPEFIGIRDSNWLWIHNDFTDNITTALLHLIIVVAHSPIHPPCIYDIDNVRSVECKENAINYTWEDPIRTREVLPGLTIKSITADNGTNLIVYVFQDGNLVLMTTVAVGSIKLSDLKCHIAALFCFPTVLISAAHRSNAPGNWLVRGRPEACYSLMQNAQGHVFCRVPYCIGSMQLDMDVFAVPLWAPE